MNLCLSYLDLLGSLNLLIDLSQYFWKVFRNYYYFFYLLSLLSFRTHYMYLDIPYVIPRVSVGLLIFVQLISLYSSKRICSINLSSNLWMFFLLSSNSCSQAHFSFVYYVFQLFYLILFIDYISLLISYF